MTLYETADNLAQEQVIVERFCSKYNLRFVKMPMHYQLDYMLLGQKTNTCLGVLECKARNVNFSEIPNVILSLKKYERLIWWGKTFLTEAKKNLACMFCCKFDDGFYGYKWNPEHNFSVTMGGRVVQTRDKTDIEPVVLIPRSYFKEF